MTCQGKLMDAGMPNEDAWAIGEVCRTAADYEKVGDYIDRGLVLVRMLREQGYDVYRRRPQ